MGTGASASLPPAGLRQVAGVVDGHTRWVALLAADDGQDHPPVMLPLAEAVALVGDDYLSQAELTADGQVTKLEMNVAETPTSPPMWFAQVDEPGPPAAVSLVGFTGFDVGRWSVLDAQAQRGVAGLDSSAQVGAIRWYPQTGEVDQVYVAPDWRRQGIARVLLGACVTYNLACGGPVGWGDGQRTAMGQAWVQSLPRRQRAAPLSHLAPPMTPPEQR